MLRFIRPFKARRREDSSHALNPYIIPPYSTCQPKNASLKRKVKDKSPQISKEKQKLLSRIKRLSGQIDAVQRSVTEGNACADILILLAAIRGGVNSLMAEILEDHIRFHITHPDRTTESPEELGTSSAL